jgi:hypothetical protein
MNPRLFHIQSRLAPIETIPSLRRQEKLMVYSNSPESSKQTSTASRPTFMKRSIETENLNSLREPKTNCCKVM